MDADRRRLERLAYGPDVDADAAGAARRALAARPGPPSDGSAPGSASDDRRRRDDPLGPATAAADAEGTADPEGRTPDEPAVPRRRAGRLLVATLALGGVVVLGFGAVAGLAAGTTSSSPSGAMPSAGRPFGPLVGVPSASASPSADPGAATSDFGGARGLPDGSAATGAGDDETPTTTGTRDLSAALARAQTPSDLLPDDVTVGVDRSSSRQLVSSATMEDGLNESLRIFVARSVLSDRLCVIGVIVSRSLGMTCLPADVLLSDRVSLSLGSTTSYRVVVFDGGVVTLTR